MATTPAQKTFDLSAAERACALAALRTFRASIQRAINAESDASIVEIRKRTLVEIDQLAGRFL